MILKCGMLFTRSIFITPCLSSEHYVVVECELKCPVVKNGQGIEDHPLLGIAGHVMIIDAAVHPLDAGTVFIFFLFSNEAKSLDHLELNSD